MGEDVKDKLALIDRPQRLGILPTMDFWWRDGNARLARPVTGPLALTIAGGLFVLFLGLGFQAVWAFQFAIWVGVFLALGLIERHIRRRARQKRALREAP